MYMAIPGLYTIYTQTFVTVRPSFLLCLTSDRQDRLSSKVFLLPCQQPGVTQVASACPPGCFPSSRGLSLPTHIPLPPLGRTNTEGQPDYHSQVERADCARLMGVQAAVFSTLSALSEGGAARHEGGGFCMGAGGGSGWEQAPSSAGRRRPPRRPTSQAHQTCRAPTCCPSVPSRTACSCPAAVAPAWRATTRSGRMRRVGRRGVQGRGCGAGISESDAGHR